jgi:ubiquitin C-terminal hydrolase
MNIIEKMNPLFKLGQDGDSKDFIIFILEQIHKELKDPINTLNNNINAIEPLNQYDKNNAFNHFFSEFRQECSIISDIFFGFTETTNICVNCKNIYNSQGMQSPICYNYQIFNCLIFPLEEVKNMKNNYNQMCQNNLVTIYECFLYNQKTELFTGENRNYCNICKQQWDSNYTSKIFVGPNILILILNRGRGNVYNVKLDFYEKIDITQFVLLKDKPQLIYELYGVISYIGERGPNAQFVASCKSPIDKKWYRYNDSKVSLIENVQKEIIEFEKPYILFYQKKIDK